MSTPGFTSTNSNNSFEQKTIPELVNVLRGTCQFDTYDTIEDVLVNRDMRLRTEKLQLQEKIQMEEFLRIQAEEEVRKREELCEKGKRVQESYETLLKEVKAGLAYRDTNTIKELKKKNDELECEVKNLKEKCVDGGNKFDVVKSKNAELESKFLELSKIKEKWTEDNNKHDLMRRKDAELESKVLELWKMKEKCVDDRNKLDVIRRKNAKLESEVLELRKMKEKWVEDNNKLDVMRRKDVELDSKVLEVWTMKEKCVDDRNKLDVIRRKNEKLEYEVLELRKMKEKWAEDNNKLGVLRIKYAGLEFEVSELRKMKEKWAEDNNKLGVLRIKYAGLEFEVSELRKMKGKWEGDGNELGVLRKKVGELEKKVLELKKLNEKLMEDNNAFDELRSKVRVLEGDKNALVARLKIQIGELEERVKSHLATISECREENCKLADEKLEVEILYKSLRTKYRELQERESRLGEDIEPLMNVDASGGGNNEREPRADLMVADFEDNAVEDVFVNVFGNDTAEAAPLRRNEDVHGVAASTQPQNIGGNDAQGASSASGRVKLRQDFEIIILDDDDDLSISQRVHEKKTILGLAANDEYPSSSVATQQKSKFINAVVDTAKRKFSFPDIETSSDDSSDDSFFDNLPISSVVSQEKKTKM